MCRACFTMQSSKKNGFGSRRSFQREEEEEPKGRNFTVEKKEKTNISSTTASGIKKKDNPFDSIPVKIP